MPAQRKGLQGHFPHRKSKRAKALETQGFTFAQMANKALVRVVVAPGYSEAYSNSKGAGQAEEENL